MESPAITHQAPGFKVTKTDTQTIFHRVPIFAECSRGDLTFDWEWIRAAVASAKQKERDGYLPPLHTRHHEPETAVTDAVRAAGVFRILEENHLMLQGKRVAAVFADLIVTDPFLASEIERMRYPYRSVEIFDTEGKPEINGLALLDHEAPYLELPMLFAGEIEDRRTHVGPGGVAPATSFSLNYSRNAESSVIGFARRGKKAVLLFRFSDDEAMTKTDTEIEAEKAARAKAAADEAARANLADKGDDKKDDKKKSEDMEGEDKGLDVAAVVKAIKSGAISVADMDAILAAIQAQGAESPKEDEAAPAPAPGAEIMKDKSAAKNFARLEGENQALKARLDARDALDKRNADVKAAMKRLEGRPLGADLEQRLSAFHEKCGGNAELFKEYVDTMARTIGDLPEGGDAGARFSGQPKVPKEAMAFQALGGEAVDKAAAFCREYEQLKKSSGMRASCEAYVRVNMKRAGFILEEKAA